MKKISFLSSLLLLINLNSMDCPKCEICGEQPQKVVISRANNKTVNTIVHNWEFHFNHAKEILKESKSQKPDELIKIFNAIKYLPLQDKLTLEVVNLLLKVDPQPHDFLLKKAKKYIAILAKDEKNVEAKKFYAENELKEELEL